MDKRQRYVIAVLMAGAAVLGVVGSSFVRGLTKKTIEDTMRKGHLALYLETLITVVDERDPDIWEDERLQRLFTDFAFQRIVREME